MNDPTARPADPQRLGALLRAAEPAARLVPARWLRRVVRRHRGLQSAGFRVPHERSYWIARDELLRVATPAELGLDPADLPETVLLLALPEPDDFPPPDRLLLDFWRLLFHAAIDRAIDRRHADGSLNDGKLRRQLDRLGATELHEIRVVLEDEKLLLPPADDRQLYREFAALFFELSFFAPNRLAGTFPGLNSPEATAELLSESVDAAALFAATRLAGAPDPHPEPLPPTPEAEVDEDEREPPAPPPPPLSDAARERLRRQAEEVAARGNDVRAATAYTRLADASTGEARSAARAAAGERLASLVRRLQAALGFDDAAAAAWRDVLRPLLRPASRGVWPVSRRLLYDLQKICVDAERPLFAVDVIEWAMTAGRLPVKRRLDKSRDLRTLRHLRGATRHAARARLAPEKRDRLLVLIHHAQEAAEHRAREAIRPILLETLEDVGLRPGNVAERIARDKIVEELLDAACERGYLRMGDLRDALARNRLKLPDVRGPGQFLRGDALLRANSELAVRLDGVYHRGEIYLRWLQRLSALCFGTPLGRFLMLFLVLPFGGAFVILEGLHHLIGAGQALFHYLSGWGAAVEAFSGVAGAMPAHYAMHPALGHHTITAPWMIGTVGFVLLLAINWPHFRRGLWRGIRVLFYDLPVAVLSSPLVRAAFDNPLTRFVGRYLLLPVAFGAGMGLLLYHSGAEATSAATGAGVAFVGALLLLWTPLGRELDEDLQEAIARGWRLISVNLLLGLFELVMAFFRRLLELVERGIYAVDEFLRFREGEGPLSFYLKAVLGVVWWAVSYVVRFAVNLLIEPQVNPIKHFPVVTVSHKLLLPLIPSFSRTFGMSLETTGVIVSGIPGIFGFLAWELKENWRLYRANQPPELGPVAVGSHGERVRGLLRPGFHSGTVPKAFARLRKAERKAERTGNRRGVAKQHHALEHVAEAVGRLFEREPVAYLRASSRWGGVPVRVAGVLLATNRIRVRLAAGNWPDPPLEVSLEERGGWVIGSVSQPGWLGRLSARQRAALADVLTGLYKLAGVQFVREQVARSLGASAYAFDARPEGLVVGTPADKGGPAYYDAEEDEVLVPRAEDGSPRNDRRRAPVSEVVFSACPVAWFRWVELWEEDHIGKGPSEPLLGRYKLI